MRFDIGTVDVRKRKRLPHWDSRNAIYSVTFNLFDAIPLTVRHAILGAAEAQLRNIESIRGSVTIAERQAISAWTTARLAGSLDENHGSCFLRDREIARLVADAVTYFDQKRYFLLCWCVMPNHVHTVFCLLESTRLENVLKSWKSFTGREANQRLGRSGAFWQEDYFDRVIRSDQDLQRTIKYVQSNPDAAGLTDWPFVATYQNRIANILFPR
jgi:REP element-mobilizing transposase RayT